MTTIIDVELPPELEIIVKGGVIKKKDIKFLGHGQIRGHIDDPILGRWKEVGFYRECDMIRSVQAFSTSEEYMVKKGLQVGDKVVLATYPVKIGENERYVIDLFKIKGKTEK